MKVALSKKGWKQFFPIKFLFLFLGFALSSATVITGVFGGPVWLAAALTIVSTALTNSYFFVDTIRDTKTAHQLQKETTALAPLANITVKKLEADVGKFELTYAIGVFSFLVNIFGTAANVRAFAPLLPDGAQGKEFLNHPGAVTATIAINLAATVFNLTASIMQGGRNARLAMIREDLQSQAELLSRQGVLRSSSIPQSAESTLLREEISSEPEKNHHSANNK